MFVCTCAGRSQFRWSGFCGCCLVGAGTEQLHIVGRKPTDLTLLPPGLNQSQQKKNCQDLIECYSKSPKAHGHLYMDIYRYAFLMIKEKTGI